MNIDLSKLTELNFFDVNMQDYPDFSDAFLDSAFYIDRDLTEEELDFINDNEPDFINEKVHESLYN